VVVGIGPKNGAAFARVFAGAGYRLALVSRRTELAQELARELGDTDSYACDVADPAAVARTFRAELIDGAVDDADTGTDNADAKRLRPESFPSGRRARARGLANMTWQIIIANSVF
jgi:NAD(P)-dependent dehydrogenase (short-subunit alcohol dehydrogenase family)